VVNIELRAGECESRGKMRVSEKGRRAKCAGIVRARLLGRVGLYGGCLVVWRRMRLGGSLALPIWLRLLRAETVSDTAELAQVFDRGAGGETLAVVKGAGCRRREFIVIAVLENRSRAWLNCVWDRGARRH
jgi:hypothetical protein